MMTNRAPTRTGEAILALLLEVLRTTNQKLNAMAADILVRIGSPAIGPLVRQAVISRSAGHRIRLLGVVERIGDMPDPDSHIELGTLLADKRPEVRNAVLRVLAVVRPRGEDGELAGRTIPTVTPPG
jgi:hypothetical protein